MPGSALLTPSVSVNGVPLATSWLEALVELRVDLQFQVPGQCQLRFVDPGYVLVSSNDMVLGSLLVISQAVPGGTGTELITAEVTSIAVDQRAAEQPELLVVAHDYSHRMGRGTRIKSYLEMNYSAIASQLASTYALTADVDETSERFSYLMQSDSDLAFLSEMASRVGYDWWVTGTTLHFKQPASASTVSMTLGDGLRSFSVRAAGHLPSSVTVDGWDRTQQQLVTKTAAGASSSVLATSQLADIVSTADSAFGQSELLTAAMSAQSVEEATALSQAILDRASAASVTARGVADGNAACVLGASIEVAGAGPLSGTYPLTRIEHIYRADTGYTTRINSGDRRPTSSSIPDSRSASSPTSTIPTTPGGSRCASPA
jgi:phage protein D